MNLSEPDAQLPSVIVTRPRTQAEPWLDCLRSNNIEAYSLPALEIVPLPLDLSIKKAALQEADLAIFLSANAVVHFAHDIDFWPASLSIAAIGQTTASFVRKYRGQPDLKILTPAPDQPSDSEGLAEVLVHHLPKRVLIIAGEGGREWLAQWLIDRGVEVKRVACYKRIAASWDQTDTLLLNHLFKQKPLPAWYISSVESYQALRHACIQRGLVDWFDHCHLLALHNRIIQMVSPRQGQIAYCPAPNSSASCLILKQTLQRFSL